MSVRSTEPFAGAADALIATYSDTNTSEQSVGCAISQYDTVTLYLTVATAPSVIVDVIPEMSHDGTTYFRLWDAVGNAQIKATLSLAGTYALTYTVRGSWVRFTVQHANGSAPSTLVITAAKVEAKS